MATTSPKMGLQVWDQLTDPYDHNQLADNFFKIDFHDHTPGRGVQIPTEGIFDGAITDAKLASTSSAFAVYRPLAKRHSSYDSAASRTAGEFVLVDYEATSASSVPDFVDHRPFYIDTTDYASATYTTKLRVRGAIVSNAVAIGAVTITFHLKPVATWGGLSGAAPTVATIGASAGSASIASPAGGGPTVGTGSDFTIPSTGWYVLTASYDVGTAANSNHVLISEVQLRHA